MSMLSFDGESDWGIASFANVKPGAAVQYAIDGDAAEEWLIIEDSLDPMVQLDEYGPDHSFGGELVGKAVGDSFNVPGGGVLPQSAKIRQIVSKYVFRYNDSMHHMTTTFGDKTGWIMGRVPSDERSSPEEALKPLLAQMDAMHTQGVVKTLSSSLYVDPLVCSSDRSS